MADLALSQLQPDFIKLMTGTSWRVVNDLTDADGIQFLCPKCFLEKGGPVGTHSVVCWKPSVGKSIEPGPGRWNMEGMSFYDLTLKAASSSILLNGGCHAHFFIENGRIRFA